MNFQKFYFSAVVCLVYIRAHTHNHNRALNEVMSHDSGFTDQAAVMALFFILNSFAECMVSI